MPNEEGGEAVYRNGLAGRSASPTGRSHQEKPDAKMTRAVPALAETQSKFRDAVVRELAEDIAVLKPLLMGGNHPEKRLRVHQRNYHTSLTDSPLVKFP